MFKGQPKGLFALALANTGERFGYYTMLAILALLMQARFGWSEAAAGQVYAIFLAGVYFMPLLGGIIADKIGYGKCVVLGIAVMFLGYLSLSIPAGNGMWAKVIMCSGLALVAIGTGLFKGNLQVLVGNLYDDPKYSAKRDSAFSLFYMAINIGAMFAPAMARKITEVMLASKGYVYDAACQDPAYIDALSGAYGLCFAVACVSLVLSVAIYFACRNWFKHADVTAKQSKSSDSAAVVELTPKQTKDRLVALFLVFAVVIFFWMAFHQNGSALTFFAKNYTNLTVTGPMRLGFNIWILALIAASVYTCFGMFQSDTRKGKTGCAVATLALWGAAAAIFYFVTPNPVNAQPSDFQQFNPFFVVALTPISMAIFGALAKKGKEPSAPKKIALGMLVAALGFVIITISSIGLKSPMDLAAGETQSILSPGWLISTYLTLTFAELLLSPMGISFVSKVAPPKYKGMMMGGWFVSTALSNKLVSIPGHMWGMDLTIVWGTLMCICLVAALFIFLIVKKLNKVC